MPPRSCLEGCPDKKLIRVNDKKLVSAIFPAEGYSHRRELDFGQFRSNLGVRDLPISLGRNGSDLSWLSRNATFPLPFRSRVIQVSQVAPSTTYLLRR
jgi:hypothetical protein